MGTILWVSAICCVAVALGVRSGWALLLAVVGGYMWFTGIFGSHPWPEALLGFFVVMFYAGGVVTGIAWGWFIRTYLLGGHSVLALSANQGPPPAAMTPEEASLEAADRFREGRRIRIRCPNCSKPLTASRVLSPRGGTPDIAIACPCQASSRVLPL